MDSNHQIVLGQEYKNIHQEVIDQSIAGSREAQSKLYHLYAKAMFNVCLRITNDYNDAEDVLQEAFVSAFRNLRSYQGKSTFGAWLKRIVVNKAINHINKSRLELVHEGEEGWGEEHDTIEGVDQSVELDVATIKEAVRQLPDGYRVVFSLYLLEGYDHQEIAGILGISESTSKSQYNRSKKKLRQLLQKGAGNGK